MFRLKSFRSWQWVSLLLSVCLAVVASGNLPANSLPSQIKPGAVTAETTPSLIAKSVSQSPVEPETTAQKVVLDNGLTVLLKPVKTAPVVSVQVWYRVGSRNEAPGVNGIAHQLEHLMFKGTKDRPIQFGRFFSALGSDSNAFTSYDMTAYFGTVERDKLEALLVLEADRMQNALINEKELDSEKRVVISELQGYENDPSYRLGRAVMRAAFPTSAYGLPVGGTKADVEKFTVDQVRQYYRTFYRPDNATLVIVGDIDPAVVLGQVKSSFGAIANPPLPLPTPTATSPAASPAPSAAPKSPIILREPGSAALLNAIYPLPNIRHPDVAALSVMDYILSSGRSSRLNQALVESGLASDASSYAANLIGGGWYEVSVTAVPGKELQQIDRVLQQAIADLREKGVTPAELDRAKAQLRANTILNNRTITNQAMQLGNDQVSTGNYRFTDQFLQAVQQVTAADVQRVARTYLADAKRTVGFFEPSQPDGQPATSGRAGQTTEHLGRVGTPIDPAEVAKYLPPIPPGRTQSNLPLPDKLTLANGLQVLLLPDPSTPTVTLSGHIQAGSVFDRPETAGLASLTAGNLLNGTRQRDYLAIANTLADRGANLNFAARREGVDISGAALSEDLPTLIQVLADVLKNAQFPTDQLELTRQQALTQLKEDLDSPSPLGRRVFQQTVYPANHPFHTFPTEASLKGITRQDVVQFYRQHYHPDATILALVGNFDAGQVRRLINRELGDWEDRSDDPKVTVPTVPLPPKIERRNPTLPGKTQSITYIGYNGIDRRDPRFYAVMVLNQILGGDTLSSRLGSEIRDRQGLTYGIYSYFVAGVYSGPFLIVMQTAPEDAQRAIDSTLKLLQQLRQTGVTASEVEAAKRSLISSYSVEQADPDNLAGNITLNAVYGLGREELRQYPEQLRAVTLEQVNQAIQSLLHPDRVVIVTAGPPTASSQK